MRLAFLLLALASTARAADSSAADAAERGDRERVVLAFVMGVDVDRPQPDGMTALHWAVEREDLEIARFLLAVGADANRFTRYHVTPLALAAENGDAPMIRLLLDNAADPNVSAVGGETPLLIAARTGKLDAVMALLKGGAGSLTKDRRGQTAVMWAAAEGHADVVSALIADGAEYRKPMPSGFSPLFFAVRNGRAEVVDVLLKAGVDVNEAMQPEKTVGKGPAKGTSPLTLAIENGHFALADRLLDAGADPNDERTGFTPLHMLTWVRKPNRGDDESGDPAPIGSGDLTSLQLLDRLVKHGANVNGRLKRGAVGKGVLGRKGATPFLLACQTADLPLMRALLDHGADPSIPNAQHATPLMAAAGLGCLAPAEEAGTEDEAIEAVRLCLSLGADVNAVDDNGETAMHGAAYKSFPRVAQLLADRGAKVEIWNRPDRYGWTPLAIAEGYRPGNFKPAPDVISALRSILLASGITPPASSAPAKLNNDEYAPAPAEKPKP